MMLNENVFLDEANKNKAKKKKKSKTDYSIPQSKFKTIDDIIKFHKKRQKGQGSFVTYDVGNMDYNNALFNKGMGSDGGAITSGGTSADGAVALAGGISNGGLSVGSATAGASVGMGESLQQDNKQISQVVKEYIEDYIDLMESDMDTFIFKALDVANWKLSYTRQGELLTLLHEIGVDVESLLRKNFPHYNYLYLDFSAKDSEKDFINLLKDVVEKIPNRYIDSVYYQRGSTFETVNKFNSESKLGKYILKEFSMEDFTYNIEDIRLELSLDKVTGLQVNLVIETKMDYSKFVLTRFSHKYLGPVGYLVNLEEANKLLDYYYDLVLEVLN